MRAMQTTKTRHQFYLPDDLSVKLEALTAKPGASKTTILTDALSAWLDRAGAAELDAKFGPRFDRFTRAQSRSEDQLRTIAEMLAVFIQQQLTLVAHQPMFDEMTQKLGAARFKTFMEVVANRLARQEGSAGS